MIFLVSLNLTGYVQCILCVDSLVDISLRQSGTFFVIWYFDCCIDCIVFIWSVCLSVSTHYCVTKDYQINLLAPDALLFAQHRFTYGNESGYRSLVVVVVNGSYSAVPYSSPDRECITKVVELW